MGNGESSFLTIQEVSNYLHIKPATLYAKTEGGELPHYKIGRLVRFKKDDIDKWMEDQRHDPIDAGKAVRRVLRAKNKSSLAQVIKKVIAKKKEILYPSINGKTDQIRDHRKEASDEPN
jgi:excisionase family DNA binding protein